MEPQGASFLRPANHWNGLERMCQELNWLFMVVGDHVADLVADHGRAKARTGNPLLDPACAGGGFWPPHGMPRGDPVFFSWVNPRPGLLHGSALERMVKRGGMGVGWDRKPLVPNFAARFGVGQTDSVAVSMHFFLSKAYLS